MNRMLRNAAERGRTGVSWLIHAGNAERTENEAREYLALLFCENGTGCGTCSGCRKIAEGVHVDVMKIDGTKVDDVRELIPFAARHPFEGKIKALYIPRVDALTEQAQNALLKLVEEPPQDTVIVLGATNLEAVLPTILSRCTVLEAPPDSENASQRLAEQTGVPLPQAETLVRAAGFDFGGALALHEAGFLAAREGAVDGVRRLLTARNRATSRIEKLLWNEDAPELPLHAAVLYLADVLQVKYGAHPETLINADLRSEAVADAQASAHRITSSLTHLHTLIGNMRACKGLNRKLALQGTLLAILEDIV